ncbi:MAG: AAA family ATPase [Pseudomonadota bacterium]
MILEGNERGYGAELARHLLNPIDNDHVTVHAVEGFASEKLAGAFAEAEAIAQGTQCQKYLFSLSLNPPPGPAVPVEVFEDAIAKIEAKLGLVGQPRAIVFHEKNGRRHARCVWSRIDAGCMRAINLAHYKRKLGDISRTLYLSQNWEMPEGFRDEAKCDPNTYSRHQAAQAKREKRDPKALKALFRDCWERSDSRESFAAALKEEGFLLARGDRRAFVAVDGAGKVWSLSRWCGVRPKELAARLGSVEDLPSIEEALGRADDLKRPKTRGEDPVLEERRLKLVRKQRAERAALLQRQEARRLSELRSRRARMPNGLRALFLRATGHLQALIDEADASAQAALKQDRVEQQDLIDRHLAERRALTRFQPEHGLSGSVHRASAADPRQALVLPTDDLPLSREQMVRDPARILAHISATEAQFTRTDVLRELAKLIDDPLVLKAAADKAMASPELIRLESEGPACFTTRDYRAAEKVLARTAAQMSSQGGFQVAKVHQAHAIADQNAKMHRAFGGKLSGEQQAAIDHVLSGRQFACVVGLAGAGKSTMLATARDAWERQGITVHGAALAGKAADGLESASGIQSRTLASLEASWENGYQPIAKGDVLVVDETGMIGTRQMARVAAKIEEIGAKLVLVGDPDQLQPIEAGTPFRDLVAIQGAARLTEIHRQREDWQKTASRDLAAGRVAEALQAYSERQYVTQDREALEALVETYAMDAAASGSSVTRLAFAHRRKDVHALNQAIRAALRPTEEAEDGVLLSTETGQRAFAPGDRIVFGKNDRELGLKNGMLGIIKEATPSRLVVMLDGDPPKKLTFDPRAYRHVDHGYAVTIHKSQGATVDRAYVLASRSMDRHLAYVAMTRHRDEMRLFVRPEDRPDWARGLNRNRDPEAWRRDRPSRSGPSMG